MFAHAAKSGKNLKEKTDYREVAYVFISNNAKFKDYSTAKILKSFFKKHNYKLDFLDVEISSGNGADGKYYELRTYHHVFHDSSVYEWQKKFTDFIAFFEKDLVGIILMVKRIKYDGTSETTVQY